MGGPRRRFALWLATSAVLLAAHLRAKRAAAFALAHVATQRAEMYVPSRLLADDVQENLSREDVLRMLFG